MNRSLNLKNKAACKTKKCNKKCSKKCSSSSSISSPESPCSDFYIRTDLWNDEPCTKKKSCKIECKDICVVQKECKQVDICVQKNLLTVCRVPLAAAISQYYTNGDLPNNTYAQLVLTYEIALINKTCNKIGNVSIFDSLAGIVFANPYNSCVEVIKCPGNIILWELDEIAARHGSLNNPEGSYLPPNSLTTLILKLAISAPENSICEIRYVANTVSIEGYMETSVYCKKKLSLIRNPIIPIIERSNIWQTNSDFIFLVGILLI